jgi:hypothetical protein
MTLHERVTAAVEKRLAVAQAATPGPWEHVDYHGGPYPDWTFKGCGSVVTMAPDLAGGDIAAPNGDLYPRSGYSPRDDMAFIAANDPARIIRDCRRDLKVLGRHHTYGLQLAPEFRKGCVHCQQGGGVCAEIRDLAEAYEIGVDDGDG